MTRNPGNHILPAMCVPENTYKRYRYYEPYMFVVNVENKHSVRKTKIYENITINY